MDASDRAAAGGGDRRRAGLALCRAADAGRPGRLGCRQARDRLVGEHGDAGGRRVAARGDADPARRRLARRGAGSYRTALHGGPNAWCCGSMLLHPLVLRIEAEGAQHLRVADAPDIPYTAGQLRLLVPLQADPSAQALDLHGGGPARQRSGRGRRRRADVRASGCGCGAEPGRDAGAAGGVDGGQGRRHRPAVAADTGRWVRTSPRSPWMPR